MNTILRVEFPPALMTREQAAYYLSMSLRDLDELRIQKHLIPVGDSKRVKYRKADLDEYVDGLPERSQERA